MEVFIPNHITPREQTVLAALVTQDAAGLLAADLAERTGLLTQSVNIALRRLTKRGLVVRQSERAAEGHARWRYWPTDAATEGR